MVTVGTDGYSILWGMLKALLLCVCQLGDRTGSTACRKWKICHIVSKLCSGRAPFLLLLPSPLCSLVWSCVDFCQSQLPPRGVEHENTKKNVFDFTGRPINSVDWRACNFQSISSEKQHVKGEMTERAKALLNYQIERTVFDSTDLTQVFIKSHSWFTCIIRKITKKEFPIKERDNQCWEVFKKIKHI